MNTEKLRELDKKFLDRVSRYLGVTMIDLETLENDLMYAVERLAAIIAEEEAREPVAWVSLLKNDSGQIYWMANKPLDRMPLGVYIYTQPPSAGGEG